MEMLTCHLNRTASIPMYEQLYRHIKREIIAGRLTYGTKLPSKRKLADYLKVSQNTIETAYDQLVAEGYIEALPRRGFFVQAFENLEYVQPEKSNVKPEMNIETAKYHFHPSRIDTGHFPFDKWRRIAKRFLTEEYQSLLLLGDAQGEYVLRQEIAEYLYHARGVQCSPEEIVIGAGSEFLLQQLINLFHKNSIYGVEDPGYHVISKLLQNYQNQLYPLDVDADGVKYQQIEDTDINIVYVTPSHHFPYGSVLSVNRRVKLLKWASRKENRYIIEDDYDSEFRYTGKSIPSLHSMDGNGKVIYLGTFSKSLIPSLRISYMVLPRKLLQKYHQELSFYHCSVSRIDQHILATFMQEGEFERHLNRMRKVYRRKLEKIVKLLKPYEDRVQVIGGHSGLHIVLVVTNGMDEETLVKSAKRADMKVYPLSAYSMKEEKENPPKIILGFAGIQEEELENAVNRLLGSWKIK